MIRICIFHLPTFKAKRSERFAASIQHRLSSRRADAKTSQPPLPASAIVFTVAPSSSIIAVGNSAAARGGGRARHSKSFKPPS